MKGHLNATAVVTILLIAVTFGSCDRGTPVNQSQSTNEPSTDQLKQQSPSQTQAPAVQPEPEKPIAPWKVVHTTSVTSSELSFALAKAAWPDDFEKREFYSSCARFAAQYGEWANPSCSRLGRVIQREEARVQREIDKQDAKDRAAGYR